MRSELKLLGVMLILILLFTKSLLYSEQVLYVSETNQANILQNRTLDEYPYADEQVFFIVNSLVDIDSEKIEDLKEELALNDNQFDLLKGIRAISVEIKQLQDVFLKADQEIKNDSIYYYNRNISIPKGLMQKNYKERQDCKMKLKEKIITANSLFYKLNKITGRQIQDKIKVWFKKELIKKYNIIPIKGKINKLCDNIKEVFIIATLESIENKNLSKEILLYKKNREGLLKDKEGNYIFQYDWDTSFWSDINWKLKVRVHVVAESGGEEILNTKYLALPSYSLGNIELSIIDNNKCKIVINTENIDNIQSVNLYAKHTKNLTDITKGITKDIISSIDKNNFCKNQDGTYKLELICDIKEFKNENIQIAADIIYLNGYKEKRYSEVLWYTDTTTDKISPKNPTTCYAWNRYYDLDISRKKNILISDKWYGLNDSLGCWGNELGKVTIYPGIIEWFGAEDEGAGIRGYHIYFGQDSQGMPDDTLFTNNRCIIYDLNGLPRREESETEKLSPKYVGTNYFRISTEDLAGNISRPETIYVYKRDIGSPVGIFPKIEIGKKWNYTLENWWTKDQTPDISIQVRDVVDWDQTFGGSGLEKGAYRYFPNDFNEWSDWIEAYITGGRGSLDIETITAKHVPFYRNGTDNIVQFSIKDIVGNDSIGYGDNFTTRVKINNNPIKFTNVWPKSKSLTGSNPRFKACVKDIENVLLNSINIMVDDCIRVPIIGLNNFIFGTLENTQQYDLKPGLHTFTIYVEDGKYLDENSKGCPSIYNGSFVIVKPKVVVKYNKKEYKSGQEIKIKVKINDDKFIGSGQKIFIKTQLYKDYKLNEDKKYITYPGEYEIILKVKENMPKDSYFILFKLYSEEDEINSIPFDYLEVNGKVEQSRHEYYPICDTWNRK